jgi:flagellar motor protein MotB
MNEQYFQALAKGTCPDFVISGYPEYGSDPCSLDHRQRCELTRAAHHVLSSLFTRIPIRAFLVVGHADKALRKPVSERAAFEREISQQRADAGREALLKELTILAGGPAIRWMVQHHAIGIGNLRPLVGYARFEEEMRRNRRIEIVCASWPVSEPVCAV